MIEIRRRRYGGYYTLYGYGPEASEYRVYRTEGYSLYVVVKDGKRIDSFLKLRNARRLRQKMLLEQISTPVCN